MTVVVIVVAAVLATVGLAVLTVGRTGRGDDSATARCVAAAAFLLLALFGTGVVAFVVAGTSVDMDTDTYTGRQTLELELAVLGSCLVVVVGVGAARSLLRRAERSSAGHDADGNARSE